MIISICATGDASLISDGWSLVTDLENMRFRWSRMRTAFEKIKTKLGTDVAHLYFIENPSFVLNKRDIKSVSPYGLQEMER